MSRNFRYFPPLQYLQFCLNLIQFALGWAFWVGQMHSTTCFCSNFTHSPLDWASPKCTCSLFLSKSKPNTGLDNFQMHLFILRWSSLATWSWSCKIKKIADIYPAMALKK